ncbi:hypothetical protein OG864_45565 [Streptomyces sp. NBC_00124]|uniref:hypothetical protein n=1 Tax=Streptomyces sp. NBC_00124 TaxID=2975662 RepID=UPI002251DB12|nr:hypothetical protein [Streptomyces sp. NBC_00124]MCX5365973.1 hypothetical protein [Streptomyces sp. NBC_00124]
MTVDPRLLAIDAAAADREPTEVARDEAAVIFDNMICGYFQDPRRTDALLRQSGLTKAADRLVEIFGPGWWTKL